MYLAVLIAILCCNVEAGSPKKKDTLNQFHVTFRLCANRIQFNWELYNKYGYEVGKSVVLPSLLNIPS